MPHAVYLSLLQPLAEEDIGNNVTPSNTVFSRIQKARDMFGVRVDADTLHFAYLVSLALALLELGQEEQFVLKDTEGEGEQDL